MKALDEYFLKCSCRCWTEFIFFLQILCLNLNRETWRWKGKSTVLINHFWLWLHKQCCIPFASNSFKWAAKTTDSTRNWNATFETSRIEKMRKQKYLSLFASNLRRLRQVREPSSSNVWGFKLLVKFAFGCTQRFSCVSPLRLTFVYERENL